MTMQKTKDQTPAQRQSVQKAPQFEDIPRSSLVLDFATIADDLEAWGHNVQWRDRQLRQFWTTEPILASAVYTIVGRNAAFNWTLKGPPQTVAAVQDMFHEADLGKGWLNFITKVGIDLFTQDNGAFIEIIRAGKTASSAVVGINHLDAGRCRRTGMEDIPVIYNDRQGLDHKLEEHQVITMEEFPSPIETLNGVQICAVSRVLRMAQFMRDISIHRREKVTGTNPKSIYLTSGIRAKEITDAMAEHKDVQLSQGFIRYMKPLILSTLDPTANISVEEIAISALPDGWDEEVAMRWYINLLAMGFGADYQDFAPLPGRALGSGTQSLVLHMKSRGKGPALFMKMVEHAFNFHGVVPRNVQFEYDEQDLAADMEQAELRLKRAEADQIYIETGVLTPEAVRQEMLDQGDISQEVFDVLQPVPDITPEATAHDEEPLTKGSKQEVTNRPDFAEAERLAEEVILDRDMAKALRETMDVVRKALLPRAKELFGEKQDPENLVADVRFWNDFRERAVSAMLPRAREGALKAAQANIDIGLAVDMNLVNDQVLDFSANFTNEWWEKLQSATRSSMSKSITAWQQGGLGKRGLPDLVKSIEPLFGKARARNIATTEITRIFDEGNILAHKAAGIEIEEFQTSNDAHVCPICEPLDGQRFPIDGGPRPVTDTHIGCRCARLPVENDITLGKER